MSLHNAEMRLHDPEGLLQDAEISLYNAEISLHNAEISLHNAKMSLRGAETALSRHRDAIARRRDSIERHPDRFARRRDRHPLLQEAIDQLLIEKGLADRRPARQPLARSLLRHAISSLNPMSNIQTPPHPPSCFKAAPWPKFYQCLTSQPRSCFATHGFARQGKPPRPLPVYPDA